MEVVEGKKVGSRYFIENGYLYKSNDVVYLKCISRGCKARATIKNQQIKVTKNCHNHDQDAEEIEKFRFREALRVSSTKSSATVKDVYYTVAEQHPSAAVEYPFPSADWRMRKMRKAVTPPVPRSLCTLRDLLESEDWRHLGDSILAPQRPFFRQLLQNEAGIEILVFVSPEISPLLNDTSIIYMDGTFKIVPHGLTSYQMTTIHVNFHNKVYPAVYALMNHRTKEAYLLLLHYIKFLFPEMHPTESMTDFETAERLAIAEVFPHITTRGCWFHFAQAVFKKHQELGLCTLSRSNPRCKKILKMLMSVPLLPVEKIPDGVEYIQNQVYAAVYALMSRRTKAAYLLLLNYIKNLYPEMRPELSMCDYEIAERLAIAEAFPGIQTKGCWFHFAQTVWKKHQQLGLCALCEENDRCRRILRMLMSLPLLPANQILDGAHYIEHKIATANVIGEFARMMQYIWDYWLCQVSPDVISVYGCTRRTNNDVENFHMQLFRQVGKQPHPSLWNFIKMLREMDRNQSLNFLAHQRGSRHCRNRRYSSKVQDCRIKEAEHNLLSGAYNVGEFLSAVSNFVFTLEAQLRFEATPANVAFEELADNAELVDDPQLHSE